MVEKSIKGNLPCYLGVRLTAAELDDLMMEIDDIRHGENIDFGQFTRWWMGAKGATVVVDGPKRDTVRQVTRRGWDIYLTVLCIMFFEFYPSLVEQYSQMVGCSEYDYGNGTVIKILRADSRLDCTSKVFGHTPISVLSHFKNEGIYRVASPSNDRSCNFFNPDFLIFLDHFLFFSKGEKGAVYAGKIEKMGEMVLTKKNLADFGLFQVFEFSYVFSFFLAFHQK